MDRWAHQALEMSQIGTEAESKEGLLPHTMMPQLEHAASETSPTAETWHLIHIS